MPKVAEGAKYTKKYSEKDVQSALEAIEGGMGQRAAAIKFNVPRSTLQFRQSNKFHEKITHGPRPILTLEEEDLLEKWITSSQKKGFPIRLEDVQESVKSFLDDNPRQNPFKDNKPGEGWFASFLRRHPNITLRTSEGITSASAVVSEPDIKKWFREIEQYLQEKKLDHILNDPSRVFNGDETCFYLCPKNKKVLAPKGIKNIYEVEHHPKANLTVMFTFSANGDTTPPMIIYPYQRLPADIVKSVPPDWGIANSDNGWMKNDIFFEYIANIFHKHLLKIGTTFPVLLFVDGHVTHLTYELSKLCSDLKIILISLYPNATRILQPADVACFKPLKNGWKTEVLQFRRSNPYNVVTKETFAPILQKVINNHLKTETVRNGFKASGIYPWCPDAIDYSKCLGKCLNKKKSNEIPDNSYITYQQFRSCLGEEKIQMLINTPIVGDQDEDERVLRKLIDLFKENPVQKTVSEKIEEVITEVNENRDRSEEKTQRNISLLNSGENKHFSGDISLQMEISDIPVIFEDEVPADCISNIKIIETLAEEPVVNEFDKFNDNDTKNICNVNLDTATPSTSKGDPELIETPANEINEMNTNDTTHNFNTYLDTATPSTSKADPQLIETSVNEFNKIGINDTTNNFNENLDTAAHSTLNSNPLLIEIPADQFNGNDMNDTTNNFTENLDIAIPSFSKTDSQLKDYIFWPKTPERKGKKNSERISFVLTSSARQRDHLKKLEKKKEEERLKEERKLKRLAAKKKREMDADMKKRKKDLGTKRKIVRKEKANLNKDDINLENKAPCLEITSNVESPDKANLNSNVKNQTDKGVQLFLNEANPDSKQKKYDFGDDISNSSWQDLEEEPKYKYRVPKTTKRNLFCNEQVGPSKVINILSDISIKPNQEVNPFNNATLSVGLCYTCVYNISNAKKGIKCELCTRTYHINCVLKHFGNEFENSMFRCPPCSKK